MTVEAIRASRDLGAQDSQPLSWAPKSLLALMASWTGKGGGGEGGGWGAYCVHIPVHT